MSNTPTHFCAPQKHNIPILSEKKREPVSHTFTDEHGEFVFGPLCPGKEYALEIWVNEVRHFKVCAKCYHEGKCLKGRKMDKCDCNVEPKCDDKKD